MNSVNNKIADAVFEGGGVKGIGLVGALKVMEDNGYTWRNVAGTSAGAIVASLIAAGYTAEELKHIVQNIDYKALISENGKHKFSVSNVFNLIFKKGMHKGNYIVDFLDGWFSAKFKGKLGKKEKLKFGDLTIPGEKGILLNNPKYKRKYKLHIIAADISRGKVLILPEDIEDYGMNPDDLEVSLAVRMSISLPYFFQPILLENSILKEKSVIVDGGILSNYPVWIFDVNGVPRYPTIGFKLSGSNEVRKHKITNVFNFSKAILETMLEAKDDIHISEMNYLRTIKIDTQDVKTTDFNISKEETENLYKSGESSAKDFLKDTGDNFRKHIQLRKKQRA